MVKSFILMLQFLTRLSVNIKVDVERATIVNGTVFFPFIGMLIGVISALTYYLLGFINRDIASLGAVFTIIAVTGGFHVDGLSDTADGFFSSRSRERILEIMKDSRVGTFGVVAILFDVLFKYVLIKSFNSSSVISVLILSCGIGRIATSMLFSFGKSARPGGLGDMFTGSESKKYFILGLILFSIVGFLMGKTAFLASIMIVILFSLIFMRYSYKVIGGLTGDVYGAACELGEIISMLVFLVVAGWI